MVSQVLPALTFSGSVILGWMLKLRGQWGQEGPLNRPGGAVEGLESVHPR